LAAEIKIGRGLAMFFLKLAAESNLLVPAGLPGEIDQEVIFRRILIACAALM